MKRGFSLRRPAAKIFFKKGVDILTKMRYNKDGGEGAAPI